MASLLTPEEESAIRNAGTSGDRVAACARLFERKRVREVGGNNRGYWVSRFLGRVGLGPGYAWCAAFVSTVCDLAGAWSPRTAGVAVAVAKGRKAGRLRAVTELRRGDLVYLLNPDGTGHIAVFLRREGGDVVTIEGNTSGRAGGSQRDGDGVYERARPAGHWDGGISTGVPG